MENPVTPWLILDVTTECNLRCKHCHLWTTKEGPAALSTEEKLRVLEEFQAWRGGGRVVLAGGETFLKPQEVFALARRARALGLHSIALSNATLLREEWVAPLFESGLTQLSISLDFPEAEGYDHGRGVAGTFDKATHWIRRLSAERAARGHGPEIHVNTILQQKLLPRLQEHLDFVRALGADRLFVFPLERTFHNQGQGDPHFERERLRADEETAAAFRTLRACQATGFLSNTIDDLDLVESVLFSTIRADDFVCQAGERNVIVDLYGNVRLCHLMEQHISEGRSLGNVRDRPLRALAEGEAWVADLRKRMLTCDQPCKLLSCNRKTAV